MSKLIMPKKRVLISEAEARVGVRGTWRGRVYRRSGRLEELRGDNLFLNSGLDLIGARFDQLGTAAEVDPDYRFENWFPHLALGSNPEPPSPDDPASVLTYVGHGQLDLAPTVTVMGESGPPDYRLVRVELHFAYTAVGGEQVAEMGICHWTEGRYLTRSLVYDLAGSPVTVSLNEGDLLLVDYFIELRAPAAVLFEGLPMPEGDVHDWAVIVGPSLIRHLFRWGFDANTSASYPWLLEYPWISAWRDHTLIDSTSGIIPLGGQQTAWTSMDLFNPSQPARVPVSLTGVSAPWATQRAWERLPYVPGSHQLKFAVSHLRNVPPSSSSAQHGVIFAAGNSLTQCPYLWAVGYGDFPATNTYLRTVFTVSWGNM